MGSRYIFNGFLFKRTLKKQRKTPYLFGAMDHAFRGPDFPNAPWIPGTVLLGTWRSR